MSDVSRLTREARIERLEQQIDLAWDQHFEAEERFCILLAELYRLGGKHEAMEFFAVDDFLDDDDAHRWEAEFRNKSETPVKPANKRRRDLN